MVFVLKVNLEALTFILIFQILKFLISILDLNSKIQIYNNVFSILNSKFEIFHKENILSKEHIINIINDINYNKQIEEQITEKKSKITELEERLDDINKKNVNILSYDLFNPCLINFLLHLLLR